MKKLILAFMAITLTMATVKAQKSTISLGVDAGVPVGLISSNVFSFVIGGSLQADFPVSTNLALTVSGGYQAWLAKSGNGGGSIDYIPLLAGIKYHFSPKVYGSGQLGASVAATSGAGTPFTYAPGIGFQVSKNIDVLLKYTGLAFKGGGSFNNVGVRLAYSFGK
jgi:hypothetical protein